MSRRAPIVASAIAAIAAVSAAGAADGAKLFADWGCDACHGADR